MVEDIVDTGMTLNYVLAHLASHRPATLRVCTCSTARRGASRTSDWTTWVPDPDEFVVGYGLDYKEEYRNLPFIGVLKQD
jgi:hypoxanthine phosphoribosyltransferase